MEIAIDFKTGKEYKTRENMVRQLDKLNIPRKWRYIVITNPGNAKIRPVFVLSDANRDAFLVAQLGFMVVG